MMMCLERCCSSRFWCCLDDEERLSRSSAMIGAQLIHEAGLVFSCSSLTPLTPGTCFNITGTTTLNCERFSVDLCTAPTGGGGSGTANSIIVGQHRNSLGGGLFSAAQQQQRQNIALHINPRLPQNYVVRNCRVAGSWGKEEVTSPLPFLLRRGRAFAMQVLVTETEYFIAVDGRHFAAFRHRLPYAKVNSLQVYGDVLDVQVDQLSILQYPDQVCVDGTALMWQPVVTQTAPELREAERRATAVAKAHGEVEASCFLEMPYYGRLAAPLRVGQTIHIYGTVKLLPHSFYVNLQHGHHIWPHPTIAFHLNPRFAIVGANNVICRNAWYGGRWDREERSEIFADFMPSRTFHMTIRADADRFVVAVNGKCITEYAHRVDVGVTDTVHVQGDIWLDRVVLESND